MKQAIEKKIHETEVAFKREELEVKWIKTQTFTGRNNPIRIQIGCRFVSDLRKIGSRISDWKLDPNGSQSEPIRKTIGIQSELIIIPMRETKFDISESILYTNFRINFIVIL